MQPHIKHHSLIGLRQGFPVQIHTAVFQVAGHKHTGLGIIPVGQRNARIGGTAGRRGNPRHHLEGHPFLRQQLDFFTAAAEDKGIAPLQAQYPLALFCQSHQQLVNIFLLHGVFVPGLAHIDQLRITAHQLTNGRGYQPIVNHHITGLHQTQGAEGQQIWITGAGTHQIHLALIGGVGIGFIDGLLQSRFRFNFMAAVNSVGHGTVQHAFPEGAALIHILEFGFDLFAEFGNQCPQTPIGRRDTAFQFGANHTRQHRRSATGRNGNLHR